MEIVLVPLARLVEQAEQGAIRDAPSALALLLARSHLARRGRGGGSS
jgi:hypothetical protein